MEANHLFKNKELKYKKDITITIFNNWLLWTQTVYFIYKSNGNEPPFSYTNCESIIKKSISEIRKSRSIKSINTIHKELSTHLKNLIYPPIPKFNKGGI
jgi:hypothetical protein